MPPAFILAMLLSFAGATLAAPAPAAPPARSAQDPGAANGSAEDPLLARLLPRFRSLPAAEQVRIAEACYQRALAAEHPLARAAAALEGGGVDRQVLDPDPRRAFDASRYAPALQLVTRHAEPGETAWEQVRAEFFGRNAPPDPGAAWEWDYGRNALIRPRTALPPEARLVALLAGRWPEPDRLAALAEASLDHDSARDAVADYFAHHYRDRAGVVFAGIRLDDAWGSGREIEVSDVEAVAWLRTVAQEDRVRSPIPAKLHDPIYTRISESYAVWREYRTLRRALAVRLCSTDAEPPPVYRALAERLDQAWVELGHDPARALELLRRSTDRPSFFAALAVLPAEARPPVEERAGLAPLLRAAASETCRVEGLLGLGRR